MDEDINVQKIKESYDGVVIRLLQNNFIDSQTFKKIVDLIGSGKNELQQKESQETFVFDGEWITQIDSVLIFIEQIVKAPWTFIKENRIVVPIEKAKRTNAETIRHLSSHSNNIRGYDDEGMVMPSKVLTVEFNEDLAIYENRFVYSLIKKLINFVDERYLAAKTLIKTHTTAQLMHTSNFAIEGNEINYKMQISVRSPKDKGLEVEANEVLLSKILQLSKRLNILLHSDFCKTLSKSKLVTTPISKTNLLMKNINYANCYKLWLYISSYTAVGYSVQVEDKNLSFDTDYFFDLTLLTALSLKTMAENDKLRKDIFDNIPYSDKKKAYRVVDKIDYDVNFGRRKGKKTNDEINQYYFDKMQQIIKSSARVTKADIQNKSEIRTSFARFYKALSNVNRELCLDIIEQGTMPSDNQTKKTAIAKKYQKLKLAKEVYRRTQQLTKLMTSELNTQIKYEAKQRVKVEKFNFEYEKMLLERKGKKSNKKAKLTNETAFVDQKVGLYVGRKKIVNKNLLAEQSEKEKQVLQRKELAKQKRREKYAAKKKSMEKFAPDED